MFNRKRKKELSKVNYLELTPVHNYGEEVEPDNKISVLIPRFTNKLLAKYLNPRLKKKSPFVKAKLDEFGSEVWRQIDGKRKVYEIADNLKNIFGDKIEPVHERLIKFLSQIHSYSFITFIEINNKRS